MKIGIFHVTLPSANRKVGGVEVFVDRLATSLWKSACDVEVLSITPPPDNSPYKHRLLFGQLQFLHKRRIFVLYVLPALMNFVSFRRYDIIHFHGSDWFYILRPRPTIRTFHGSALREARAASSLKRKLSQYAVYPLEHLSARLATLTLGVGLEAAKLYHTNGVSKLFVSKATFFPGIKRSEPTFIFIGTWEGRKRGKFVAECFLQNILPRIPTAQLLMASDVVPEHPSIVSLVSPSDADLARAVRESWALLSGSTYEGFGIPYLEAMASGTVVVTTRNSGAEYVLANGEAGIISDDAEFPLHVIELVENPAVRNFYETKGLARAQEFSEDLVIAEHIRFYHDAIRRFNSVG